MDTILLAPDGSLSARRASALALDLAEATRWPLSAMSAWDLPSTALAYAPSELVTELCRGVRPDDARCVSDSLVHQKGGRHVQEGRLGDRRIGARGARTSVRPRTRIR